MSRTSPRGAGRAAGLLLACVTVACALALGGCGGDDEGSADSSTTQTIEPATPTGPTGAAGDQGVGNGSEKPPSDSGGVDLDDGTVKPPPESGSQTTGGTAAEDSAENDIPPEPGSAEEAFEKYCDENPGTCG